MLYRRANISELTKINAFIRASKGFWGYSEFFLDSFMQRWGLKAAYFQENEIILLEKNNDLIGLYAFKMHNNTPELDLFFITPNSIRQGIGSAMWQHALQYALEHDWNTFQLLADPNAEEFYTRMGAKTIKKFESFPGRFVPVMRVDNLKEKNTVMS